MRLRSLLVPLTLSFCLLGAATAQADTRFAGVNGVGSEPCDSSSDPCDIETAVEDASAGDEVILLGGVPPAAHYVISSGLSIPPGVTVHGGIGARPRIQGTFSGDSAVSVPADAVLRDVSIDHSDPNNTAVFTAAGTVERVHAQSGGGGCIANPDSLVRDSVCWSTGATRAGFTAQGPSSGTVTLRNVTAVGTVGTTPGLNALAFATNATLNVNATNVIAYSEGGSDVAGSGLGCCTGQLININLDHSNYDSDLETSNANATVTITDPGTGTNTTAPPVFADPGNGDFSQDETSVGTINLGVAGIVNGFELGAFDLDGQLRNQGGAPDIGADELPVPPAPGGLAFTPPGGTENNPKLSGVSAGATSYDVYPNATCQPPAVVSAIDPAVFEGDGVTLTVPDGTTSTFSVTATGPGGTSACSATVTYTETTTPPPGPGTQPKGGPTGQRAKALKKCKKVKDKAKRKKCKRKARRLPV